MKKDHRESVVGLADGAGHNLRLPPDCVMLPLSRGALLVSRGHAVFCRVPSGRVEVAGAVIGGSERIDALGQPLIDNLSAHGFFSAPRSAKDDAPTVQLQLTNACNLACGYCCTNSGKPRANEVCYERLLQVARQIPEVVGQNTRVALLGGEPFTVPWAIDLASAIMDLGLDLTIFTNGIPLADPELARRTALLAKRGLKLRVSLAGSSEETCDALSGTTRFNAALEALNRLASFGGTAAVDLMLVPGQAETVARDLPRLRKRLPEGFPIALGVLYMSGRETGAHLFRSRSELDAALDCIAFEAGESIAALQPSPVTDRRDGCGCALGNSIHIRSDGALFNCFKMEEKIGDLDGVGFPEAVRMLRTNPHRATTLPTCAACALATICGAGCRSENLIYTGDADRPPCGPWRVRVMSELLADDMVAATEWPVAYLLQEAAARGIDAPTDLAPSGRSRHLVDV